jgi:hypothetical protein
MNSRVLILFILVFWRMTDSFATPLPGGEWPPAYYMGWSSSVRGGGFGYHSPVPGVNTSLLVRSEDSTQYVEWLTQALPQGLNADEATFVWIFGIDANPSGHTYTLFVNGKPCLRFDNPILSEKKTWTVKGEGGTSLVFRTTMIDKYGDLMGYAFLTLPKSMLVPGVPQRLKVCGESAGSRSWYMTFEAEVKEGISLKQEMAVLRGKEGPGSFCVKLAVIRLGEPAKAEITQQGQAPLNVVIEPGYNSFSLLFPWSEKPGEEHVKVKIDGQSQVDLSIRPVSVRPWTIFLVQHTHTDIGYTRPQTEILPEHLRYIDYALDYCDQTDTLPEAARFRWTCETSWAVREYLATRPLAQIERLKKRAAEGRIEITSLYLNSSDLGDEATIAASLQPVSWFRSKGFRVRAAMQDDINGVPWCLPDFLSGAGIEFLNMGQNTDRALKPFSLPTTFWWESPSGKRIIVNRPEHYMFGNYIGVITGVEAVSKNLLPHLAEIAAKAYPFNEYAIQFSGYFTDNSPPSTKACEVVRDWNETYLWPRLRLATISEFLSLVKEKHSGDLPVYRGAWPDWWIDGFGSAALTTSYTRMAHTDYIANNGLMSMGSLAGRAPGRHVQDLSSQVLDDLAFYDEHTFGAAESITDPFCENSVVQLGEKLAYTWDAVKKNRLLREEVMGQIQDLFFTHPQYPSLTLLNTLGHSRSGNAEVYIDHQLVPSDRKFRILDASGSEVPKQSWSDRAEGSYYTLFAKSLPPFGFRTYTLEISSEPLARVPEPAFSGTLENSWYRIIVDRKSGMIRSIYDREAGRELADTSSVYSFGEFIYETLGKNREQISNRRMEEYKRKSWEKLSIEGVNEGPVWMALKLKALMPGCASEEGVHCEIRLYKQEKKLEFRYSMKKLPVTDPEAVYIAFPFAMDSSATISYEVAGGCVKAGSEQLSGSSTDWQGIQNFLLLKDRGVGITLVSPEIPIVQLGGINTGRFSPVPVKPSPLVFSWVLNNYWTTNFLASQEGELRWTYVLTSGTGIEKGSAAGFAWDCRIPVLSRVLPSGQKNGSSPREFSWLKELPPGLLLVNAVPGDGEVTLQLRETAGNGTTINPAGMVAENLTSAVKKERKIRASLVNVLGETIRTVDGDLTVAPLESLFIKLSWNEQ